jgi:hypothetical protein
VGTITGSDYAFILGAVAGQQREDAVFKAIVNDDQTPTWLDLRPVIVQCKCLDGLLHTCVFRASPDFLCIGTDDDYLHVCIWPTTAQRIADAVIEPKQKLGMFIPTKRMVGAIYSRASSIVPLESLRPPEASAMGASAGSTLAWRNTDKLFLSYAKNRAVPIGSDLSQTAFVDGHKKSLVVGPNTTGQKVIIYGGAFNNGNFPIQPLSDIHTFNYSDYSHGTRLVARRGLLDGKWIDLFKVISDEKLWPLLSNQGPFYPKFPNETREIGASFPQIRTETSEIPSTPKLI